MSSAKSTREQLIARQNALIAAQEKARAELAEEMRLMEEAEREEAARVQREKEAAEAEARKRAEEIARQQELMEETTPGKHLIKRDSLSNRIAVKKNKGKGKAKEVAKEKAKERNERKETKVRRVAENRAGGLGAPMACAR
jgi:hypothetical protein